MSDILHPAPRAQFNLPKFDFVWAFILLSVPLWWILRESFGLEILDYGHDHSGQVGAAHKISQPQHVLDSLIYIAPYFAFAIAIGAYAVASDVAELVNRAFNYNQPLAIALAAAAGAFSPLCSCGVIPLIAAMLVARVPIAPIMAFWLASPLMAPEQFVITQAALSVPFATAKGVFAVLIGLMGGYVTYAFSARLNLSSEAILRPGLMPKSCCGSANKAQSGSQGDVQSEKPVAWAFWTQPARRVAFAESAWSTALFLGKWLILAFVLEALMLQLNIVDPLVAWLSHQGALAVPLSAMVGIPAYLNGDAAPLLISSFVDRGLSQGAAMAFLIGGGVTCIPAAVAVWSLVRPQVFALYLFYGISGAVLAGFAANFIL